MSSPPVLQKSRWPSLDTGRNPRGRSHLPHSPSQAMVGVVGMPPVPSLAPCGGCRSCRHWIVDIAATSKTDSPLSLLLWVSCFRVEDPGRHLGAKPCSTFSFHRVLAAKGQEGSCLAVASVWGMGPAFHQDTCCARFPAHVKGLQTLGSLSTASAHLPAAPYFHTGVKTRGASSPAHCCIPSA